jgi:hypothetical protein
MHHLSNGLAFSHSVLSTAQRGGRMTGRARDNVCLDPVPIGVNRYSDWDSVPGVWMASDHGPGGVSAGFEELGLSFLILGRSMRTQGETVSFREGLIKLSGYRLLQTLRDSRSTQSTLPDNSESSLHPQTPALYHPERRTRPASSRREHQTGSRGGSRTPNIAHNERIRMRDRVRTSQAKTDR